MTPNKLHHAGLDWIPHTPGDPMPCPPDTRVRVLFRDKTRAKSEIAAKHWYWHDDGKGSIIGWHPIEEQPSHAPACDHIIGEWDHGTMESFLVYLSESQPLGKNGTKFNFCPLCGEKLNKQNTN